jgi:hypothetical protein
MSDRGLWPGGEDWEPDVGSLLGGIVVGVVIVGAVWLLASYLSGDVGKETPPAAVEQNALLGDSPSTASRSPAATRLQRCATAADDVERPLHEAGPALDQWEVHVGAMNKLVVGAITLPQATAFWNQTRVGAYDRIGRFEDAEARLERRGVDCPALRLLGSGASPELRACVQHVAAERRALDSARTAITTWEHHMLAMDKLRAGKLSPTAATQMWMMMWQRGVDELKTFRGAESTARHTGSCGGGGTQQPSAEGAGPSAPSSMPPSGSPMPGMSGMP